MPTRTRGHHRKGGVVKRVRGPIPHLRRKILRGPRYSCCISRGGAPPFNVEGISIDYDALSFFARGAGPVQGPVRSTASFLVGRGLGSSCGASFVVTESFRGLHTVKHAVREGVARQ